MAEVESKIPADPGRFLTRSEVERSVGIKRTKIYELIKSEVNPFPKPIRVGGRAVWVECFVNEWKRREIEAQLERR